VTGALQDAKPALNEAGLQIMPDWRCGMLRKLLELFIEAFSLAGKMEAEGAVPYEWEDLNTWANRPYIFSPEQSAKRKPKR
jgi:hypothetical protein